MRFWDFIFPNKHDEDNREKEGRRATKEALKRRKEKEKKQKSKEPLTSKGSKEASSAALSTSIDIRALPKSDMIEETSAVAASTDPGTTDAPKSWEYDESDATGTGGSGTIGEKIKEIADKSVRRVRRISSSTRSNRDSKMTSRPIKEKTLDRFMERVKARQESRVRSAERVARESECVFPEAADAVRAESIVAKKAASSRETTGRRKNKGSKEGSNEGTTPSKSPREKSPSKSPDKLDSKRSSRKEKRDKKKKNEKEKKKDEDGEPESIKSTRSEKSEKSSRRSGRPSPLKHIQKIFPDLSREGRQERKKRKEERKREKEETARRKTREKNLFVNGRPFWVASSKMTEAEKAEMTQDDLPLNAEIILEVRKGNIDLPVMPNTVIKFDPWAPLEVLQGRDETMFNHKMLFANTIRSMINSADFTGTDGTTGETVTGGDTPPAKEKHHGKRIDFGPHPTFYYNYDRTLPTKTWKEGFRWKGEGVA